MSGRIRATRRRGPWLKIVALPRNANPYQRLLYEQFEREGHSVRYAGELTRSHTLNLLLLPGELAAYRLAGWRILHVHWVFAFQLPGSDRVMLLRRLAQTWFGLVLTVSRLLKMRIVWTVHNVVPHERVFHDEIAARRRLAQASDLVLVHSSATLQALEAIGIRPSRSAVITQGSPNPDVNPSELRPPGAGGSVPKLLFFGQVIEYKGVEDLLLAVSSIPATVPLRLLVAGQCRDSRLRERLARLADASGGRVELRLRHVPEEEVTPMFAASDVVVLPFRRVTNSSSALQAMGYGRVLVLPDLPAFASMPPGTAVFYDGSVGDLTRVIVNVAQLSPERLQELGAAAESYIGTLRWADAAEQTLAAIARAGA